jgi:hypothetical protein
MGKRGQSLIEYAVLTIILLAAFFATQNYIKRGIQGRWKTSVDELGDQYDPRTTCSVVTSYSTSNANTVIAVVQDGSGKYTSRVDTTQSVENKVANTAVGSM